MQVKESTFFLFYSLLENHISSQGVSALAGALEVNQSLQTLE